MKLFSYINLNPFQVLTQLWNKSNQQVAWVNAAKGITISLVVIHHTLEGLNNAGFLPDLISQIHSLFSPIMMPLFFIVAGLFAKPSLTLPWRDFFKKKIVYFIYLYFLWSIIIFSVRFSMNMVTHNQTHWYEIFLILFDPMPTVWFIYALMIAFLLTKLVMSLNKILVISLASAALIAHFTLPKIPHLVILNQFMYLWLYFLIGFYASEWIQNKVDQFTSWWFCWVSSLLFIALGWFSVSNDMVYHPVFYFLLSVSGITAIFCISRYIHRSSGLMRYWSFLGESSLQIYLCHFIPIAATRIILTKLGVDVWWLLLIVCHVVAICFCLFVRVISERGSKLEFLFNKPLLKKLR